MATVPTQYSPDQIAMMDVAQRQAYFASLPPAQRQAQLAAFQQVQMRMNSQYMTKTVRKISVCPQSSGGALSQNWTAGAQLNFTIPSAQNAFCEGILVRLNMVADFAAGTSAVYAANAAAPYSLFDMLYVNYNGTQIKLRPYILREYDRMRGYLQRPWASAPLAGNAITSMTSYLTDGTVPITGADNAIDLEFYVPFNALHPQDARGLLPIMGGETIAQVQLTCAPQVLGVDPILNTWSAVSGSGHAVTFDSGTVKVYAVYRDGTTFDGPQLLGVDLSGMGTCQVNLDTPLTGITAATTYRQKIGILDKLYYVVLTIVDGEQSTIFSDIDNLSVIELSKDMVGSNVFWRYGTGTNLSVYEYFAQLRGMWGQDLSEGVMPIVYAPTANVASADALTGTQVLNTSVTGWTDVHYGVQLAAVGSVSGITPRVESHVFYVNSAGLIAA
jgi:hypothetical protein